MRATINRVYFGKARQIVSELRSLESTTETKNREEFVDDIRRALSEKQLPNQDETNDETNERRMKIYV